MNNQEFEKLYLNKFKPDNSYETLIKRVKQEQCSKIADELYAAYSINEVKDKRIVELEKDNAKLNQRLIDQEHDHRLQIKDFKWFGE